MSSVPKILAMDTVFSQGSVALLAGEEVVAHAWFEGHEGHVALLPQEIVRLLAQVGWRGLDLDLLAVTLGPGSFSGSRIALGVAKGISLAVDIPIIGVSTLEVLVEGVVDGNKRQRVAALLDARRQEVYAALYELDGALEPILLLAPGAWNPALLAEKLAQEWLIPGEKMVLIGNGLIPYAEVFQQALGADCELADPSLWRLDAAQVGKLALRRMDNPDEVRADLLEPFYLRRADATPSVKVTLGAP